MSDMANVLAETAERAFTDVARASGFEAACEILEASGVALVLTEAVGGDWADALAIARAAGAHGVQAPVAELIVAARFCEPFEPGAKAATIAPVCSGACDAQNRFSGVVSAAAWGAQAHKVLTPWRGGVLELQIADALEVERKFNPAGEARDALIFEQAPARVIASGGDLFAMMALMRAGQMAGAMTRALALSVEHANTRVQFGKPIGKFQAIQHALATYAEEDAAAAAATAGAAEALDLGSADFEIAAAKLRANKASVVAASVAHQVHGAIGFTMEHSLNHLTRRLYAWRSEYGGDAYWAERLGDIVAEHGATRLWREITSRGDRAMHFFG